MGEIEKLAKEMEDKAGYLRVVTPHISKEDLFLEALDGTMSELVAEVSRVALKGSLSTLDLNRRRAKLGAASSVDVLRAEPNATQVKGNSDNYLHEAALAANPAPYAAVTQQRLETPEPGNWLNHHRTYDAQRYTPLEQINRGNVKGLKLAYAVAIGGGSANENLQATPLAEDGYLYVVDQWGVLYKIDGRDGQTPRIIWRMDPGQEKLPLSNRGAALAGNLVITVANYPARVIGTNRDTGKIVWETIVGDRTIGEYTTSMAPLVVGDNVLVLTQHIKTGALTGLAVTTAKRTPLNPCCLKASRNSR